MAPLILKAILVLGGLGFVFSIILGIAHQRLAVPVSPKEKAIRDVLPGVNCGVCGFAGCDGFAHAIVEGRTDIVCPVGGEEVMQKISEILGIELSGVVPKVAIIHCKGGTGIAQPKYEYHGIESCTAAKLLHRGHKVCEQGCLGFGDCVRVCPFGAITMGEDRLPVVDYSLCTGCGKCVAACPQGIIELMPRANPIYVACKTTLPMKQVRLACKAGCNGCGLCEKVCPEDAVHMEGRLPVFDLDKCTRCGICVEKCPTKVIVIAETEARVFSASVSS